MDLGQTLNTYAAGLNSPITMPDISRVTSFAPQYASVFNYGDPKDPKSMVFSNPGNVDLSQTNPLLWAQIESLRGTSAAMQPLLRQSMDPHRYDALRDEYGQRAETASMNRFARMGLGGSSVAMGAADEAYRQNDLSFRDRQMGEALRAMQAETMLNANITKNIMMGQAQYAGYEGSVNNAKLRLENMEQQAEASDNALWGSILGAAGTVAGALIAGPAGAAGGNALGNIVAPRGAAMYTYEPGSWTPTAYNSPNFGPIYGLDQ